MNSVDMDASFVDMDDQLFQQLAAGGGDGNSADNTFSVATGIHLRKNLASKFEEHAAPMPTSKPEPKPTKRVTRAATAQAETGGRPPKNMGKLSTSSNASSVSSFSISDRIAKFEQRSSTVSAAPSRPPLPISLPQADNSVPSNRMSVYLRIRPMSEADSDTGTMEIVRPSSTKEIPKSVLTFPPSGSRVASAKQFDFHQVLDQNTTQRSVYSTVASPLVAGLCDGILNSKSGKSTAAKGGKKPSLVGNNSSSALLFSYGITNAGKTHTILGSGEKIQTKSDKHWGILPRAIADILSRSAPQKSGTDARLELSISFFEVYNEQIYDLLPKKTTSVGPPKPLKLCERHGQSIVRGLTHHRVSTIERGIELVQQAHDARATSSNNINVDSSRSHCVCQLQIVEPLKHVAGIRGRGDKDDDDQSIVSMGGYSTDEDAAMWSQRRTATLSVVDLAGSERSKRTGLSGRQKEAAQINKSLMTLMRCLTIMRENTSRQRHSAIIPFRESKLTHLFMGHLTGPSARNTAMLVNVNPRAVDFDETQHVLTYASKSKSIDMDQQQKQNKRQLSNEGEYDSNGRRLRKKPKQQGSAMVAGKIIKKIVRKLSPKKPPVKARAGSRKASPPRHSLRDRHEKRHSQPTVAEKPKPKGRSGKDAALEQALAETDALRKRVAELEIELENKELQVRSEVFDDMEEHIKETIDGYKQEVEKLREEKRQFVSNEIHTKSVRKANQNHVESRYAEYEEQIQECEEEMVRMREAHAEEIAQLKAEHEESVAALEKSKIDTIRNYERLLYGGEENRPASTKGSKVLQVDVVARKPLSAVNQ